MLLVTALKYAYCFKILLDLYDLKKFIIALLRKQNPSCYLSNRYSTFLDFKYISKLSTTGVAFRIGLFHSSVYVIESIFI